MTSPASTNPAETPHGTAAHHRRADHGSRYHGYMSMQARGTVTVPPTLRKRYGLDAPGTQLEVTEREDGVWEVRPMIAVPASEAWFWTPAWRAGEEEVDAHVARGEVTTSESAEDFLADLAALTDDPESPAPPAAPAAAPSASSAPASTDPATGSAGPLLSAEADVRPADRG